MSNNQLSMPDPSNEIPGQFARPVARLTMRQADVDQLTVLAHELRNYLTPSYAHLTALYARAQRDQRAQDMRAATRGRQALDAALTLIANLLEAARMERGVFDLTVQPLNLCQLVEQAVETFDTEVTPIVARVPDALIVHADRERLRQVMHNLLANARTHSPRGGLVTLELTTEWRDRAAWACWRSVMVDPLSHRSCWHGCLNASAPARIHTGSVWGCIWHAALPKHMVER